VSSGAGSVTVDHVNAGTGLQQLTVVGVPVNAVVNIPAFTPGTQAPVVVTFTAINPNLPVDFILRAASTFHAANIRVRCGTVTPTPNPTPTPVGTPTPSPTPQICTPATTVTEGNLFPGGIVSFGVTSGPGSVTVDHVNAGTGLQSLTVVGVPINAVVNIPPFTPGTQAPVVVTFTAINPNLPVDFTLRAASTFHAANIRVRCGITTPTPTPNTTPGGATTFSGRATSVNATLAGVNATLNDTGSLPVAGGFITRLLTSGNLFGGALTTGLLNATTQGAGDQSRSQAIVANLNWTTGGSTITSDLVPASSQCTCVESGPPVCDGGVMIANLRINGVFIPIAGVNQTVNLAGGGTVIINEHIRSGAGNAASLTVNGVRVNIPPLIAGTSAVADVILATARSEIACGTP
jgi:hypothetical protein